MRELIDPWLPIEEAPLDGTMIILWDEKSYGKLVLGAMWWHGNWYYKMEMSGQAIPIRLSSPPSHFMYYPAPPKRRI